MSGDPAFVPHFSMPLISPRPSDCQLSPPDYYAEVGNQTIVTLTNSPTLPEQVLPSGPPQDKALIVTVSNPDSVFQYAPTSGGGGQTLPPWRTLFAMMGGTLSYVSAAAPGGLNPFLPPPYNALTTIVVPGPPAGLPTTTLWGTLVLRLWGADILRMQEASDTGPACSALFYVGVDEASASAAAVAALALLYPQARFDEAVAGARKPALQDVVEGIKGAPYVSPPTYAGLINDYAEAFVLGNTSVLVKGGTEIGKAVIVDPATAPLGRVELWAVDASPTPEFQMVSPYFWAGAFT